MLVTLDLTTQTSTHTHTHTRMLSCFINVLLCIPMSYSLPGSSVHGTLQAGIWRGLPCPPLGNLPQPGIEPTYLMSSALAGRFFTTSTTWEAIYIYIYMCLIWDPWPPKKTPKSWVLLFILCLCLSASLPHPPM